MKAKLQDLHYGETNVYNHLVHVLKEMALTNNKDSYHLFEYFSQKAKHPKSQQEVYRTEEFSQYQQFLPKIKNLLNKPNTGTQEEPAEPGPCGYVPNLMQEAKWFQKAGVGFGQDLTYLIFKALERFSIVKQVKELKFWGKIIGTTHDYYIAEGTAEGGEEGELPPQVQPKGTGVNKMTYWVTTDLLSGDWKELPLVNPDQINISRKIKYLFTGNLEQDIVTNPYFHGKEKHLLKCQIVRINYSCTLVPRTMFNVNAQDKKQIQPAGQQWKLPNFAFLSSLENWVHHPQNILKNGRLQLLKPVIPQGVEVDEQKLMKELQLKDPLQERLKQISKDKYKQSEPAWAIKIIGDTNEYRAMSKNKEYVNYGFICIKSLIWKGWNLIYHNKQWSSLYVGNGAKTTNNWFYPKEPELVMQEKDDRQEQPQPNFPPEEKKPEGAPEEPKPEQ